MTAPPRHGGGVDAAIDRYGGKRGEWLDLSTGINRSPRPLPEIETAAWTELPDRNATRRLLAAARSFWSVPDNAEITAAPGLSAVIARLPDLMPPASAQIREPTYGEYARAFSAAGWRVTEDPAPVRIIVNPNNPDGKTWSEEAAASPPAALAIIDESFCDASPGESLIGMAKKPEVLVLKGVGKFWGLAGARLGFAIGDHDLVRRLGHALGPWPVSGPAIRIGIDILQDQEWARAARERLAAGAERLDGIMHAAGCEPKGGTGLFRLYGTPSALDLQEKLAYKRVWSRVFPWSKTLVRLGLPGREHEWKKLSEAVESVNVTP